MSTRQRTYAMAERTPYLPVDAALRICNVLFAFVAVIFNVFVEIDANETAGDVSKIRTINLELICTHSTLRVNDTFNLSTSQMAFHVRKCRGLAVPQLAVASKRSLVGLHGLSGQDSSPASESRARGLTVGIRHEAHSYQRHTDRQSTMMAIRMPLLPSEISTRCVMTQVVRGQELIMTRSQYVCHGHAMVYYTTIHPARLVR
jgi:hypothetical protein